MTLKNKINLSLAVFSILIICFIVFAIEPLFAGVKNISKDLIFQKQQFASLETKIKELQEFKVFSQTQENNLRKIDKLFINSDLPVKFIGFLESVSYDCKIPIKISSLSSKKEKQDQWQSLNFQIISSGAFSEILRFLEKMENSPYLITIQNVNIKEFTPISFFSGSGKGLPGDVNINLLIKVYAQ